MHEKRSPGGRESVAQSAGILNQPLVSRRVEQQHDLDDREEKPGILDHNSPYRPAAGSYQHDRRPGS